ncbi:MAG: beta-N-acetylhexosaminidase [Candidatus Heimdallarchaeota archaeon]|nr:beta-N-acetylhexosaminidase [Candidatus Heimdallarchaeota archaeon]
MIIPIIPKPNEIRVDGSTIEVNSFSISDEYINTISLPVASDGFPVEIQQDNKGEGYTLSINSKRISISGGLSGIQYALQSLYQLYRHSNLLPILIIKDAPRFQYRGFMLDEGRHFQGKEAVKRYLDLMFMFKLNTFHWHLTEDQGWRIEIKSYPKLTEIGSIRNWTQSGGVKSFITKGKKNEIHQGYYTQEDIIEIVEYAATRHITIIPEIDMPGHTLAALASYPELGCTGENYAVANTFGIFKDIMCVGKESTFAFIETVLTEIVNLFPGEVIHIGGDEAPKDLWKTCESCQKRLHDEGLSDEDDLQGYFSNRVAKFLKSKDKQMMGWNEILTDNLEKGILVQHWMRGKEALLSHLRSGGKVVESSFFHYYLDYDYRMTPLRKTYQFSPIPEELEEEFHDNILGIEAPLWTEWVDNQERADWQVFPRLLAVAESAWSMENNYQDFKVRLKPILRILEEKEVNYANKFDPKWFNRFLGIFTFFMDKN